MYIISSSEDLDNAEPVTCEGVDHFVSLLSEQSYNLKRALYLAGATFVVANTEINRLEYGIIEIVTTYTWDSDDEENEEYRRVYLIPLKPL